jgi:hypothetical protein
MFSVKKNLINFKIKGRGIWNAWELATTRWYRLLKRCDMHCHDSEQLSQSAWLSSNHVAGQSKAPCQSRDLLARYWRWVGIHWAAYIETKQTSITYGLHTTQWRDTIGRHKDSNTGLLDEMRRWWPLIVECTSRYEFDRVSINSLTIPVNRTALLSTFDVQAQ